MIIPNASSIFDVYKNYKTHIKKAGLKTNINDNFNLDKMTKRFGEILDKYVKVVPTTSTKVTRN